MAQGGCITVTVEADTLRSDTGAIGSTITTDFTAATGQTCNDPCVGVAYCFDSGHPDYDAWIATGQDMGLPCGGPACWCNMHQCQGDAAGDLDGSSKGGYYWVGPTDLTIMLAAWLVTEPPFGPGIASIPDGICTDFERDLDGSSKGGYYYVGPTDLSIMLSTWLVTEPPFGPGLADNTCGGSQ